MSKIDDGVYNGGASNGGAGNDDMDIDKYFYEQDNQSDTDNADNKTDNKNDIIVGIDMGTSNSCIGIWRNKNLEIIPDAHGSLTIPSVVSFTNKSKYVGKSAKNQMELNPENSFYEIKRLLGKKYDDPTIKNDS